MSNVAYDYVASVSKWPLRECPTCHSRPQAVEADQFFIEPGTYMLDGEEHECDCATQKALYRHYVWAGIPLEYHTLDWNRDFTGSDRTKEAVREYIEDWPHRNQYGLGMEFYSTKQGTGKTFAATWIGKELVKRGVGVFFINFNKLISLYQRDDNGKMEHRVMHAPLLILDEVIPPYSEAQLALFSFKLEEAIRHRTNFNLPTLMTTNMTPDKLRETYTRSYSLLEPRQLRVEMTGEDFRLQNLYLDNHTLSAMHETRPVV